MSTSNGANQAKVKAEEFTSLLRKHGILTEDCSSGQASFDDNAEVKNKLHHGVKLLVTNSKSKSRIQAREKLKKLLVQQAAYYHSGLFDELARHGAKIRDFLRQDEQACAKQAAPSEDTEMDMHSHGWVEGPLFPIEESDSEIMGIQTDVTPMHIVTPEAQPIRSVERPQQMTPSVRGDCNVTLNDCLPKKVAQLERALTYARYRANKQDIAEVVGYGALGMSMVDGTTIALAMISFNAEMFPLLASMQKKGGLAYLLSSRSIFDDVQKAMESYGALEERVTSLEEGGKKLEVGMMKMQMIMLGFGCLVIGHLALELVRSKC